MSNNLDMMKMFMLLTDMSVEDRESKVKAKARIVFATDGIIKPNDWDTLSLSEKERRLTLIQAVK
tara:strand:+ start:1419 stop:1613 length:195 start_codon:yes stop_codon:yes gene_type:complete